MAKEDERLIIEQTPSKSLIEVLATLTPLVEDFPPIPELALDNINLSEDSVPIAPPDPE